MKNKAVFALLLVLAVVLEAKVHLFGVKPNLTVIFAFYLGMRHGPSKGALYGALIGALEDTLAGGIIGPRMLGTATVGFMSTIVTGGLFVWTPVLGAVWFACLVFADGMISYTSLYMFSYKPATASFALLASFVQALFVSPAGLLIKPGEN